ncbi:ornithine carbamoyltransferase [Candidatus Woesearchaeota archaeon]|nr:ornithine carbamoyltransferase [Candidatus Woesearchaeota archaeon]
MIKHFLEIRRLSRKEIIDLISLSIKIKKNPKKYSKSLLGKTLLLFFEAPSLRTEVSLETAIFQMGGEPIAFHAENSPWKFGKETIEDVARVISQYCDIIALRIYSHEDLLKFAKNSKIPVINAMTNFSHPLQIIADFMTILEMKKRFTGLKLCYLGDGNNNVTNSLLYGCSKLGINISVGCPAGKEYNVQKKVINECRNFTKKNKSSVEIYHNAKDAVKDADVIYTDSWMSYRINPSQKQRRLKVFKEFQVNNKIMKHAKKNAIFMHCLPAKRGDEVTKEVIDGKQSVVLQQAKNRLFSEKAVLYKLLRK